MMGGMHWRESLAVQALRWNAGYSMVMATGAAVFAPHVGDGLGITPRWVVVGAGATFLWGAALLRFGGGTRWRPMTVAAVVANLAAAATLAAASLAAEAGSGREIVAAGGALQVFAFAAVQGHALWSPFGR